MEIDVFTQSNKLTMKKINLVLMMLSINMFLYCQSKEYYKSQVILKFNNYSVCDLSNNFDFFLFCADSNNNYQLKKLVIENDYICCDSSILKNEILNIIFRYKGYTFIFDMGGIQQDHWNNSIFKNSEQLIFCISKKKNYKKYIKKSYSKRFNHRQLKEWEFDISCNGLDSFPKTIRDPDYRKYLNTQYQKIEFSQKIYNKYDGSISVSYSKDGIEYRQSVYFLDFQLFFDEMMVKFQNLDDR